MFQFQVVLDAIMQPSNFIFCFVIIFFFICGFICSFSNRLHNFTDYLPNLCASIGVFGTFWGIFIGLTGFDSSNITNSVPPLIEGMKTAFLTSLVGMFASLILKLIYNLNEDRKGNSTDEIQLLQNISNYAFNSSAKIDNLNDTIVKLFKSDDDHSLVNQITLIRSEIRDNHDKTQKAMKEMIDKFADMASKSLIDELKNVVNDFNVMLNDLVSQSFKDLKDSTERLNQWQNEYKSQINENENNLKKLIDSIHNLGDIYSSIANSTLEISSNINSISESMSKVKISGNEFIEIANTLRQQSDSFKISLEQIVNVGKEAKEVIPNISERMNNIIDDVAKTQSQTNMFVTQYIDSLNTSSDNFRTNVEKQSEALTSYVKQTLSQFENSGKELTTILTNSSSSLDELFKKHIDETQSGLQNTLTQSLTTFAGSLAEISNRFANDYLPLADRLREIVHIAEGIKDAR